MELADGEGDPLGDDVTNLEISLGLLIPCCLVIGGAQLAPLVDTGSTHTPSFTLRWLLVWV
jgi:hypothetical protein